MIRNDKEYRHTKKRLSELEAELQSLLSVRHSVGRDELDSLGELVTKARIACGLTQAELGEILGMTQQQVQRYERDGWQNISLWRLAEAADALGMDLSIRARLPANTARAAGVG